MKEACVSSGMKARRTSGAIGRLTRSGILDLGFTPHTVLSRTRCGFCMHHIEFARWNSFLPVLSSLFYGHLCADDPPIGDFFIQERRHCVGLCFGGFREFVRQVGVLFGRPLQATFGEQWKELDVRVFRCGGQCMQQ